MRSPLLALFTFSAIACGDDLRGLRDVDTTAPITSATPLPGTYREKPEVTLTANEDATIYYTLDGSTPTTTNGESGDSPVTLDEDLEAGTLVQFFAIDEAGNREAVRSAVYGVDRLGPAPVDDLEVTVAIPEPDGNVPDSTVTWRNPRAPGFVGVVIARVDDVTATHPEDDETYEVGDDIPGGGVVVYVGTGEETGEPDLNTAGGVTYMAWALYDTGLYSDPRAGSDLVPMSAQTGQLTVDVGAGTVTVADPRDISLFTITGDNVQWDVPNTSGNTVFDLTITPTGPNLMNNVKLVVTGISGLIGTPALANADGAIADGGEHDGRDFRYYGPEPMVDGTAVTRQLSVSSTLVNSVFTVDFAIVRDRGRYAIRWSSVLDGGASMLDLASGQNFPALPVPPTFGGTNGNAGYRGAVLSRDGRWLFAGVRNQPRVDKIDLVTGEVVGGLDIQIDGATGAVPHMFANQARTRLYALVNDGMHIYADFGTDAELAARVSGRRDLPDAQRVILIEIDPADMSEVGRVVLYDGDSLSFLGRRLAVSPDDRFAAVAAGNVWRQTDASEPDATSFVFLVDLSTMTVVDTDPDTEGDQAIDLTGTVSATALTFTADGARVVTNTNYNYVPTPPLLGAVINLDDFAVTAIPQPETIVSTEAAKTLTALPDGRVVIAGEFAGLYTIDPVTATTAQFTDLDHTDNNALEVLPNGVLAITGYYAVALVDVEAEEVAFSLVPSIATSYCHNITLTAF